MLLAKLYHEVSNYRVIKRQSRDAASAFKRERKEKEEEEEPITSTPRTKIVPTIELLDNVFETTEDSLAMKVQNRLQTSEDREALRASLGPLGQKYVEAVLKGTQDYMVDYVYGVYLHKDGLMFGNKLFDVDDADNIIIDGVRYVDTSLYELIFKRIPDHLLYMENDLKYKSMLLATNEHKHKHQKQKKKKSRKGLPHAMILNDNAIDYVHWDDSNELMDRLRLLPRSPKDSWTRCSAIKIAGPSKFKVGDSTTKIYDLTPLDFFSHITNAIQQIQPDLCEKVIENWIARIRITKRSRGGHLSDVIFHT
ncbi:hypothetical protein ALC53_05877 [Atta colombica]|uniref:DUF8207 domain-containing protein n=1 Tax=Atta colombica TaxID=520822 RepID=A0A151I3S2_9HYME|nr:hypothetical protein ALC53_05877 [Atta colombica]